MGPRRTAQPGTFRNPIFARVYARLAPRMDANGGAEHRSELLAGLSGRVLEVGAGTGRNFAHYPATVTDVVAVEPEDELRARAVAAAARAAVPVQVLPGVADALPAEDATFDAAVASLVLCSVPEQRTALAELFRVLRPGGELRFYEHVAADSDGLGRLQRAVDRVWPAIAGGCHTHRDTVSAITEAGFVVETCRRFTFPACRMAGPFAPHVIGTAQRPAV